MVANEFDEKAVARLRLAAEEVAWLTGRGYPLATVSEFVATHHSLEPAHRDALAVGTCSEPQYRRRAAREVEAEDVARRPLAIDTVDVVACIEAALDGRIVLETIDGSVRALGANRKSFVVGTQTNDVLDRVLAAAKEHRPSILRFYLEERAVDLATRVAERAKAAKAKAEVVQVADVVRAIGRENAVVTGDSSALDAAAGWFNLVRRVIEGIPEARIVRLQ